jgi:chromosome segregation ATPase
MARDGITYDIFLDAYKELEGQGVKPSVTNIRELLKQGSFTTIGRYFKEYHSQSPLKDPTTTTPAAVSDIVTAIWEKLTLEADERVNVARTEATTLISAADELRSIAVDDLERVTADLAEMDALHNAAQGQIELLNLDLKAEHEQLRQLTDSHQALMKEFALYEAQSQAHLHSVQILQTRELQSSIDRLEDLKNTHSGELNRMSARQESERQQVILELDHERQAVKHLKVEIDNLQQSLSLVGFQKTKIEENLDSVTVERNHLKEIITSFHKQIEHQSAWMTASEVNFSQNSQSLLSIIKGIEGCDNTLFHLTQMVEDLLKNKVVLAPQVIVEG